MYKTKQGVRNDFYVSDLSHWVHGSVLCFFNSIYHNYNFIVICIIICLMFVSPHQTKSRRAGAMRVLFIAVILALSTMPGP